MKKIAIETDQAPAAIGPYTQALAVGPFVFVSGQIPVDPQGNVVPGDIVVQTCQVIANLKAILMRRGPGLERRGENHGLSHRSGRFPGNEPGLRRIFPGASAGPQHRAGSRPGPGRFHRDRRHCRQTGLADLSREN